MSRNRKRIGAVKFAALAVGAAVATGGVVAYKVFSNRPGEAAIQLIPADAAVVLTVDTHPSAAQATLFQQIGESIRRNKLDAEIDKLSEQMSKDMPIPKAITKRLDNSFALAVWMDEAAMKSLTGGLTGSSSAPEVTSAKQPTGANTPQIAVFVATNAPTEVASEIKAVGNSLSIGGITVNEFSPGDGYAGVVGNYLVMTTSTSILERIAKTRQNPASSLAEDPAFKAARAALPSDANMMTFVSPSGMKLFNAGLSEQQMKQLPNADWVAMGATLRAEGIQFDFQGPMDAGKFETMKRIAAIAPLEQSALDRLPAGAYGLVANSQVGEYIPMTLDVAKSVPEAQEPIREAMDEMKKETGLDIERDFVSAFKGNMIVAAYPTRAGDQPSVDFVGVMDNAHGANPGELVDKLRAYFDKKLAEQSGKQGAAVQNPMEKRNYSGVECWSLSSKVQGEIKKQVAGLGGPPAPKPTSQELKMYREMGMEPPGSSALNGDMIQTQLKDKTFAYAVVNGTLVAASSNDMLNRTVDAIQGKGDTLASDAKFEPLRKSMTPGAQSVMLVSVGRIMEQVADALGEDSEGGPISMSEVMEVFGGPNAGFALSAGYDGKVSRGSLLLPLNHVKLVDLIGKLVQSKPTQMPGVDRGASVIRRPRIAWLPDVLSL